MSDFYGKQRKPFLHGRVESFTVDGNLTVGALNGFEFPNESIQQIQELVQNDEQGFIKRDSSGINAVSTIFESDINPGNDGEILTTNAGLVEWQTPATIPSQLPLISMFRSTLLTGTGPKNIYNFNNTIYNMANATISGELVLIPAGRFILTGCFEVSLTSVQNTNIVREFEVVQINFDGTPLGNILIKNIELGAVNNPTIDSVNFRILLQGPMRFKVQFNSAFTYAPGDYSSQIDIMQIE